MLVHHVTPLTSHRQTYAPAVLRGHGDRFIRYVIAVNNQNRDFGQCHKLRHWHRLTLQRVERAWHRGREFFFGEDKAAARFESDNGFDLVVFHRRVPAWSATLRVGEEDSRAGFVYYGRHRIRNHIAIEWPGIRGHLTEILVQRFFVVRELNALKILWPHANAELIKPHLFIRFRRNSTFYRRAPGAAPAWLIDKIS
ncbi:hypothetical protein D3C80_1459460 [compost metagenome]